MLRQTWSHDDAPWWSRLNIRSLLMACLACLLLASPSVLAAARSTHVVIKNNTDRTMTFLSGSAKHGIVTMRPPRTISPGAIGELFAESNGVATGTEGSVLYALAGIGGNATFNWDNPFVGSNSASGSGPTGYQVAILGDTGNRTLVFFSLHDASHPAAVCSPAWVLNHLGSHAEDSLDSFSKDIGFLSTPLKRLGLGGWVDTGCDATAVGSPVRDAQHSTDGFWTIDVKLQSFMVGGESIPAGPQRFVRIEVEPNTPASGHAFVRTDQPIRFSGRVLIDTHHGDELIEVHPYEPITLESDPLAYGPDTCKQGFVWRGVTASDHVCVSSERRDQTVQENSLAGERREPNGGAYGPDTCKQGFVWRGAVPEDHVCVSSESRAQAAEDNRLSNLRKVRP